MRKDEPERIILGVIVGYFLAHVIAWALPLAGHMFDVGHYESKGRVRIHPKGG